MIPPFDASGALPTGRFQCTKDEARKVLVDDLPEGIAIREEIWKEFEGALQLMKSLPCEIPSVFLGGTFATNSSIPSDVDLTFLIDRDTAPQPYSVSMIDLALISIRAATNGKVDCYVLPWVAFGNIMMDNTEMEYQVQRGWWDDWWQRYVPKADRNPFERHHAFPIRGYLEVLIDGYH